MKSGEGTDEKRENFGEKLRRAGKKGGQITPIATTFSRDYYKELKDSSNNDNKDTSLGLSARKLGATLWELDHYNRPLAKMHHGGPRLRRLNHHQGYKDKGGAEHHDPSPSSPDLPGSSGNLRRHIAALMQHHRLTERSNHAIQPVSPASYGSSMEIAPYNPAVTPSSSIELQARNRDPNYSLRTSTELLKVLNRIWTLEEQHISNMSLVKALKKELDHARLKIKELVHVHQSDRHEMEELVKQITEDKQFRKNKEQDKLNAAINSMRDELEDERKLRKRSESLHRKLARELHDVKTSFSGVSKELENERKSRNLLEDLCDEFALGIRGYEKELHAMRQKSDEDNWDERDDHDQLILHVSESWLDERLQMKMQPVREKTSTVDKLGPEIEAFIQSKRSGNTNCNAKQVTRDPKYRRNSLESIPLNMAVSAPQVDNDDDDDNDSAGSDSNCFELKSHNDEKAKQKLVKKKPETNHKGTGLSPSSLQVKFEEQMAKATSNSENKNRAEDQEQNPVEINEAEKGNSGFKSNNMIENLIRNHYLLSENGKKVEAEKDYVSVSSIWRGHPSPVRQWTEKLPAREVDVSESSSKLHSDLKENSLKAKLLEARTRGQRSRSRLKSSIIPGSRNE